MNRFVLAVATVALVWLAGVGSAFAAQRFAAPGGSGSACTADTPCDALVAIESASAGDEVILAGGTYNVGSTQIDLTLPVTVHAADGAQPPLLVSTAPVVLNVSGGANGALLQDLRLRNDGTGFAFGLGAAAIAERIEATAVGSNAIACVVGTFEPGGALLRDSVCHASGASAVAVTSGGGSSGPGILTVNADLVNVTAIAPAAGSAGVFASSADFVLTEVDARNVIAQGGNADVGESNSGASSFATVDLESSNYDSESDPDSSITDPGTGGNQTAPPQFVDAAGGNFRELASSPTRNAGTTASELGAFDLDRAPRIQGPAPDIGAFEFDQIAPVASITSGPGEGETIATRSASFGFSASEPGTFECSLDGGAFGPCSGPGDSHTVEGLADGDHTFAVRATDPSGNVSAAANRAFAVEVPSDPGPGPSPDTDPPTATITKGPKNRTVKEKATFKFTSDEAGSTFECKRDRKPFKPCTSPRRYKRLDEAKHKFLVRATDPAGNTGAADKDKWRVMSG